LKDGGSFTEFSNRFKFYLNDSVGILIYLLGFFYSRLLFGEFSLVLTGLEKKMGLIIILIGALIRLLNSFIVMSKMVVFKEFFCGNGGFELIDRGLFVTKLEIV